MSADTAADARQWQGPDHTGSYQDAKTGDWGKLDPATGNIEYDAEDPRNAPPA